MTKLPINIDDLLHQRAIEGERIEFKKGWNPEDVLHSLCAFANDFQNLGGGYIVIGVEEQDGQAVMPPVGISPGSVDTIRKEVLRLCSNCLQPQYNPLSADYTIDGKTILVLWAPGGELRPYKAKVSPSDKKGPWAYYIRKQSSTVQARGENERELLGLAGRVPFDDRYNQTANLGDISKPLMKDFLTTVGSDLAGSANKLEMEALGRQLNVVGGPPEAAFPKNVGLLFFNETPEKFFPATQIDVVWLPEGAGGDRIEEKVFKGPLARITKDAIKYIERHFLKEITVKSPTRPEADRFWNFPLPAVEEAVVNAIYHRSYEEREPVEVRITPEDLVVLSFPGPDRSIKMDQLRAGKAVSRRYRNRRIGEFLKELELTEGRSTGIPKILRAMKENGSPSPEFETDEDRISFLVRLLVHPAVAEEELRLGAQDRAQDGAQDRGHVGEQAAQILTALKGGALSLSELMESMGLETRTGSFKRTMKELIDEGLIEYTIPNKPTSGLQKYRLTRSTGPRAQSGAQSPKTRKKGEQG